MRAFLGHDFVVPRNGDAFLTGGISRKMHLHARRLRIDHPDGSKLDVTAELPRHFAESVATLGFDLTTKVGAGENSGRNLRQDFVVLSLTNQKMSGGKTEFAFNPDPRAGA